jgi:hypothetical protein
MNHPFAYASLRTASKHWRGIPTTAATRRQLRSTFTPLRQEKGPVA